MSTIDNLKEAFAGESQASRKYTYFAEAADKAGNPMIARLFRAAAAAETVHARNHLRVMGGIKSDRENLEEAIGGEHEEFTTMYPTMIDAAKEEGNSAAERSFDLANKVEQVHHKLFSQALQELDAGGKKEDTPIYVCKVCGYTVWGEAPERCPVCGAPHGSFNSIA